MTSFLKYALAALGLAAAAAVAPAAAQAPAPSPAAMGFAKDIMVSKQASEFYKNAVPGLVEQAKASLIKDNLDKQKDLNEVAVKVAQDLKGRETEVGDIMARVYAGAFTEQELRDISNFYKTPLGKKVIENEPKVLEQSMEFINLWSQKFTDEIVGRFKAEMKKRGKDI